MRERVKPRFFADRRKDFRSLPVPPPPPPPPAAGVDYLWTGVPTSSGIIVTAKLNASGTAASARLVVSTNVDLSSPVYSASAAPDSEYAIVRLSISGLTAATEYHYGIEIDGDLDDTVLGRFKTVGSGAHNFSFAFGACSKAGNIAAFNAIQARTPAFFLHLGDFHYNDLYAVYADALVEAHYQANYDTIFAERGDFHRLVPNGYIFNDHDFLANDVAGKDAGNVDHPKRAVPIAAFRRRVPVPFAAAGATDACYHSFIVGRCRFVVLDTYADATDEVATDNASKSKLGATQKTWLKAELSAAAAASQFVFLVTGDPFRADSTSVAWGYYATERIELADYITSISMDRKVLILSAGQHELAIASTDYTTTRGAVQPNFSAGPLSQSSEHFGGPWDVPYYPAVGVPGEFQQYGYVDVADNGSIITVTFTGYSASGTTRMGPVTIDMSDRDVAPDFYNVAVRAATASATTLAAVTLPSSTGLNGLLVAVCASRNNDTHTCPTSGWTKRDQTNSGGSFTVSTWTAAEGAAAPTFNWTNASAGYARIGVYASPTGPMFNGVKGVVAVGSSGAPMAPQALASSVHDSLILAIAVSAAQHTTATNDWEKFSDIGTSTADMQSVFAGRRLAVPGCQMPDLNWTSGTTGPWVLTQLELAVA